LDEVAAGPCPGVGCPAASFQEERNWRRFPAYGEYRDAEADVYIEAGREPETVVPVYQVAE
jgi:hypothetical protein